MPTYNNTTSRRIVVDGTVFNPNETLSIDHYIKDDENNLVLVSDEPLTTNPIVEDTSVNKMQNETLEISFVYGSKKQIAQLLLIEVTLDCEMYRNTLTNTPPLILRNTKIYEISNKNNQLNKVIIKCLNDSTTITYTIFKSDQGPVLF